MASRIRFLRNDHVLTLNKLRFCKDSATERKELLEMIPIPSGTTL